VHFLIVFGLLGTGAAAQERPDFGSTLFPLQTAELTWQVRVRTDADFLPHVDESRLQRPIDEELRRRAGGAMLDWHPAGDGFRLSAGAHVDRRFRDAPDMRRLPLPRVSSVAPALSLGYAGRLGGFDLGLDAGLLFPNAPRERFTGSVTSDLRSDRRVSPALQLSLSHRF
jgi:hypothetical protein